MRQTSLVLALGAALACARTKPLPAPIPLVTAKPTTAFSLRQIDIAAGTGAAADPRKCFYVHYTGWLTDGKKFDSSRDTTPQGQPRTPIAFPQGLRRVIAGWDLGFEGMRVGGKRRLLIPYQLAYGERGRPPLIPGKAELVFDIEHGRRGHPAHSAATGYAVNSCAADTSLPHVGHCKQDSPVAAVSWSALSGKARPRPTK